MSEPATTQVAESTAAPESEAPTTETPAPEAPAAPESEKPEGAPEEGNPESPKPEVPEKYELKLSEGSLLDESHLETLSAYAAEKGLTQEQAQSLLEREESVLRSHSEKTQEAFKAKTQAWVEDVKSDKELGGDAFSENVKLAQGVISRFATPEFKQVLDESGLGNHPELVRMLVRIGKASANDQAVDAGAQTAVKSDAELFYGSQSKE